MFSVSPFAFYPPTFPLSFFLVSFLLLRLLPASLSMCCLGVKWPGLQPDKQETHRTWGFWSCRGGVSAWRAKTNQAVWLRRRQAHWMPVEWTGRNYSLFLPLSLFSFFPSFSFLCPEFLRDSIWIDSYCGSNVRVHNTYSTTASSCFYYHYTPLTLLLCPPVSKPYTYWAHLVGKTAKLTFFFEFL